MRRAALEQSLGAAEGARGAELPTSAALPHPVPFQLDLERKAVNTMMEPGRHLNCLFYYCYSEYLESYISMITMCTFIQHVFSFKVSPAQGEDAAAWGW